jgi:hypothetical protein
MAAVTAARKKCARCGGETLSCRKYCPACKEFIKIGSMNPAWAGGPVTVSCPACGKEHEIKRATFNTGYGRFCDRRCMAMYRSAHPPKHMYNGRGGTREDLGIYVRSSWEANWARYLNFLKARGEIIAWEYEADTFEFKGIKRGTTFYTPDFKVTEASGRIVYHEVKGYMTQEGRTKLKRMKKYYPHIIVELVDATRYRAMAKMASAIVPGWE